MTPEQERRAAALLREMPFAIRAERQATQAVDDADHARVDGWRHVEGSEPYEQLRQAAKDARARRVEIRKEIDQLVQDAERLSAEIKTQGEG